MSNTFDDFCRQHQKENEQIFVSHAPKEALAYLAEWSYWYGMATAEDVFKKYKGDKEPFSFGYFCQPSYRSLRLVWFTWYGTIKFAIYNQENISPVMADDMIDYTLVHQKEYFTLEAVSRVAAIINQFALTMFPGLTIHRNYCMCDGPHDASFRFGVCQPIGDKWLCEECVSRYLLPQEKVSPLKQETAFAKAERAKMTPSLRFAMLQRDAFTCRGCGRSPLRNEEVVLCVDHIHPVSLGGKTEPSNLQTLCFDCNSGKSNKLAPEMAREVA